MITLAPVWVYFGQFWSRVWRNGRDQARSSQPNTFIRSVSSFPHAARASRIPPRVHPMFLAKALDPGLAPLRTESCASCQDMPDKRGVQKVYGSLTTPADRRRSFNSAAACRDHCPKSWGSWDNVPPPLGGARRSTSCNRPASCPPVQHVRCGAQAPPSARHKQCGPRLALLRHHARMLPSESYLPVRVVLCQPVRRY